MKSQINTLISIIFLILFIIYYTPTFSQTGYVMGYNGTLLKTTNGGDNWILKPTGTTLQLWESFFINSQTGWIVGGNESGGAGILLITTNAGENWAQQPTGITNRWFTELFFINEQTGFIIGEQGTVMKTTNAGSNWNLSNTGIGNVLLEKIIFTDYQTGWITGWYGNLFKTTNGGSNWITVNSGTSNNLYTAYFTSPQTGYLSGSNGTVMKTTNQGANWFPITTGTAQEIFSIFFFDDNHGWVAGHLGTLRYTTDSGNSWSGGSSISTTVRLEAVQFINLSTGWTVGGYVGSAIYKSIDGGANWVVQNANTNQHFCSVNFGNNLLGIEPITNNVPSEYKLYQNYPNPFNPSTKIRLDIPAASSAGSNVVLKIYDELGKEAATLLDRDLKPGTYEIEWNAGNFSTGVYFYRLQTGNFTKTRKIILSK